MYLEFRFVLESQLFFNCYLTPFLARIVFYNKYMSYEWGRDLIKYTPKTRNKYNKHNVYRYINYILEENYVLVNSLFVKNN